MVILVWLISLLPSPLPYTVYVMLGILLGGGGREAGDRVSLCSPDCPGICSVDKAGFELTEIHLPLPPKYWD